MDGYDEEIHAWMTAKEASERASGFADSDELEEDLKIEEGVVGVPPSATETLPYAQGL